ncbi:hypothetical protein P7K49_010089, partial [Saguinus oedipus]
IVIIITILTIIFILTITITTLIITRSSRSVSPESSTHTIKWRLCGSQTCLAASSLGLRELEPGPGAGSLLHTCACPGTGARPWKLARAGISQQH